LDPRQAAKVKPVRPWVNLGHPESGEREAAMGNILTYLRKPTKIAVELLSIEKGEKHGY
jgi:hypothetical protein